MKLNYKIYTTTKNYTEARTCYPGQELTYPSQMRNKNDNKHLKNNADLQLKHIPNQKLRQRRCTNDHHRFRPREL